MVLPVSSWDSVTNMGLSLSLSLISATKVWTAVTSLGDLCFGESIICETCFSNLVLYVMSGQNSRVVKLIYLNRMSSVVFSYRHAGSGLLSP